MERIRQAIELDKKSHPGREIPPGILPPTYYPPNPSPVDPILHEAGDVNYTQTRVVELNEEHLKKNRIVAFNKNDSISMNFDLLRTLVLQKMEENGWRTLAITSPTAEAGKTVLAINLAMSIAQQTNKTSMLVDFDLRRPKIGTYLGLPMDKSLNDLLQGDCTLPEALVNPGIPRLVILPTQTSIRNSSETLSSKKVADLIRELRERYESRIIIFDLPPLLATDDSIALLPQVDCTLLVVANGMSTKQEIENSIRLLPAANLLGTVLNKAEVEPRSYYY